MSSLFLSRSASDSLQSSCGWLNGYCPELSVAAANIVGWKYISFWDKPCRQIAFLEGGAGGSFSWVLESSAQTGLGHFGEFWLCGGNRKLGCCTFVMLQSLDTIRCCCFLWFWFWVETFSRDRLQDGKFLIPTATWVVPAPHPPLPLSSISHLSSPFALLSACSTMGLWTTDLSWLAAAGSCRCRR